MKRWVHFKYERLQGVCYNCGLFGHEPKHCSIPRVMAAYNKDLPKYGPFLTVTKPRMFRRVPFGDAYEKGASSNQDLNATSQVEYDSNKEPVNTMNNEAEDTVGKMAANTNTSGDVPAPQIEGTPTVIVQPNISTGVGNIEG